MFLNLLSSIKIKINNFFGISILQKNSKIEYNYEVYFFSNDVFYDIYSYYMHSI